MIKHIITSAAAALLVLGGVACTPTTGPTTLPDHPVINADPALDAVFGTDDVTPAPPAVVTYADGEHIPNIEPPTRLDITGVDQATCDQYGGTLIEGTCQGVDY